MDLKCQNLIIVDQLGEVWTKATHRHTKIFKVNNFKLEDEHIYVCMSVVSLYEIENQLNQGLSTTSISQTRGPTRT